MSLRALSSDPLGAKGESRFQEICEDAGLICNKATRDRTGWDFIVEFQFEAPGEAYSLDNRAVPISCHVQVKTVLTTSTDRFKVRLSSAERLAKELKPAFICVLKVKGVEFIEAYLIHIIDKPLERILKRLREAEVGKDDLRSTNSPSPFRQFSTEPELNQPAQRCGLPFRRCVVPAYTHIQFVKPARSGGLDMSHTRLAELFGFALLRV